MRIGGEIDTLRSREEEERGGWGGRQRWRRSLQEEDERRCRPRDGHERYRRRVTIRPSGNTPNRFRSATLGSDSVTSRENLRKKSNGGGK